MCCPNGGLSGCILLHFVLLCGISVKSEDTESNSDDKPVDWRLIFGYICFAIGAVLIIFGFARLIWWALWDRKIRKEAQRKRYVKKNFTTAYYKDPWLREPSMASVASRHGTNAVNGDDADGTLHIENEAIYAQPIDATNPKVPYMTSLHPGVEHEPSQTESQIYGSRSTNSQGDDMMHEIDDGVIYSVPERFADGSNRRSVAHALDTRGEDTESDPPAVPSRDYGDAESLSEAERLRRGNDEQNSIARSRKNIRGSQGSLEQDHNRAELSYPAGAVRNSRLPNGPERDYSGAEVSYPNTKTHIRQRNRSPERVFSAAEVQYPEASTHIHEHATRRGSGSGSSISKKAEMRKKAARPKELSGGALYNQDKARNGLPPIPGSDQPNSPTTPGSVKSMKSLYQYMLSEEPLGLEREMDYTFVSSYH